MAKNNLARKLGKTPAFRTFAVSLAPEVADQYVAQAGDRDTGALLSDRLEDPLVVDHTSEKPLYFSDADRQALEGLLQSNFSKPSEVIERLRSLFSVIRIEDAADFKTVVLSPNQLYRMTDRANIQRKSVPEFAAQISIDAINREIGLY